MLGHDGPAPYAPASTVIDVIERFRASGFNGQPVDHLVLQKVGVAESLVPRVIAALKMLDLIDADGQPTEAFTVLKNAPSSEYHDRLADWVRGSYAPIFGFCDPATADPETIEDGFRGYTPEGQRPRMASLFTGLCVHAGIISEQQVKPRGRPARAEKSTPNRRVKRDKPDDRDDVKSNQIRKTPPVSEARERYVAMLLARAEAAEDLSQAGELFDRIERALGIADHTEGASP